MTIIYNLPPIQQSQPTPDVPQEMQDKMPVGFRSPMQVFEGNQWEMVAGLEKVVQDMLAVLTTPVGCHFYQPDYGSELYRYFMERYSALLKNELTIATQTALATWVDEITVLDVQFDETQLAQSVVLIIITFVVNGTASVNTLQIPQPLENNNIKLPASLFAINGAPVFIGVAA